MAELLSRRCRIEIVKDPDIKIICLTPGKCQKEKNRNIFGPACLKKTDQSRELGEIEKIQTIVKTILDMECKKCRTIVQAEIEKGRRERVELKRKVNERLSKRTITIECPYCEKSSSHSIF